MDRVSTMETNPVLSARVLFNAFSQLRRPAARSSANLYNSNFQPSLRDSILNRQFFDAVSW